MGPDYELGARRLREALLHKSAHLPSDFTALEMRLTRNLYESRVFGDEPANRVEWAKIMDGFIRLAREELGIDFNDLCQANVPFEIPSVFLAQKQTAGKGGPTTDPANTPHYDGTGKQWAVLVGVNKYEDKTYPRLQVCANDLTALYQHLSTHGFSSDHIHRLGDTGPERPRREHILTTLKLVADATQPDDLLLFYYTGHGDVDGNEAYLVTQNGYMANLEHTAVSITQVKNIMHKAAARAKVIILDACHAGALLGTKGPRRMSPEFMRRVFYQAEGMAILSSCKQDQVSYEWEKQKRSVFTYYLLAALQGQADNDEKGFVTVTDINRYVTDGVKGWAIRNKSPQTPTIQAEMAGEIIVCHYAQQPQENTSAR